ncbi:ABC transporter permease, partial [Pelomicrobium sp. G1]
MGLAFSQVLALIGGADSAMWGSVGLSLRVSLTEVGLAALIGLPVGAAMAVARFPGRRAVTVILNALMGLQQVIAGLLIYLLLSRAGPL